MFFNYIKIAFRNLKKYRFISFINLFGLTVGLTCCLLIVAYIAHELSYDKYNRKANNIYRVTRLFRSAETGVTTLNLGSIAPPAGPLLKNDFKEIETVTRLLDAGQAPLKYEDKKFNEQKVFFADDQLFNVFDVTMVTGDKASALSGPYTVMLSESMAKKYFGNEDPMNKTIRAYHQYNLKVTGVYKSFPSNAHMHPELLISFNTLKDTAIYGEEQLRTNWGNNSFFTYIVLPDNYNPQKLEAQFPAFIDRHITNEGANPNAWTALNLQKLTDIHLRSHLDYEAEENGDIKRIYIFSAIALFILLIACINYMNLSTARSTLRAREIGIRKVVGARKKEIIAQFLSESVLISFVAMLLAVATTTMLLPWLNKVAEQHITLNILFKPAVLIPLALTPVLVGVLSGIYPALFMSSFKPVKVLKGLFKVSGNNISFRQVLVTVQFTISIILIISTAVVFKQLQYMQQKSLGFDRDHVLTLPYDAALTDKFDAFRTDLKTRSDIKDVTRSSRIPTGRLLDASGADIKTGDTMTPVKADIKFLAADQYFLNTYGVRIVAGRGFSKDYGTDTSAYVVNEAAVRAMGFTSNEAAVGKAMRYGGRPGQLIGVINDFHFESMHQTIVPLILTMPRTANSYNRISIKISGNQMPAAISAIERIWAKFLPDTPFEYTFLDDNFDKLYKSEQRQGTIFTTFASIAIFIACLGLFGLSAFAITQRIKEIGVRKVLGASTSSIVRLISKDFLKLVIIAAVIAFPIAWYAMHTWLQDFAYRTNIQWWIFLVALVIAGFVALATISIQAIKAAMANPVKSLRAE